MGENKLDNFIKTTLILSLLWVGNEVVLAPWLKSMNIIFSGIWISFFAVVIIVSGKRMIPATGSVIAIGIMTAFFKFLLTGFSTNVPFFAVLIDAFVGEVIFLILKTTKVSSIVAGISIFSYTAFHPIIHGAPLLKSHYYLLFRRWLLFWFDAESETTIRLIYLSIHVIAGIISGLIAWFLSEWLIQKIKEE